MHKLRIFTLGLALLATTFFSCDKEETFIDLPVYGPEQVFYAISGNTLLTYNAKSVKTNTGSIAINNLGTGERLISMDFNPYTGQLYALSNLSKIFVVNTSSGVANPLTGNPISPALNDLRASLDFDPSTNTIRIVTALGQSISVNPETGEAKQNTDTQKDLFALASNGTAGTAANDFYAISTTNNALYKQTNGATTWTEIGKLEEVLGTNNSFDISPDNKNVLITSKTAEGSRLFTIDLVTGKATLAGKFATGIDIQCIAIPANPIAYGISGNDLVYFNPSSNGATVIKKPIAGLQANETVLSLDMRPRNGQLFAIGSSNRLYTVNPATGVFTAVGGTFSPALNGTAFGADFDPSKDVLTVISNTGQQLSITANGTATSLPNLPVANHFSAIAYSTNFANAGNTTLYAIDAPAEKLFTITGSTVTEIDSLKTPVNETNGFDIYSTANSNTGWLVTYDGTKSNLYNINLSSGLASAIGELQLPISCFCLGLRF